MSVGPCAEVKVFPCLAVLSANWIASEGDIVDDNAADGLIGGAGVEGMKTGVETRAVVDEHKIGGRLGHEVP